MKFLTLVDQIKTESRVKSDANFDELIVSLLNELFKEAVESQRPFELKREVLLAIVPETGLVTLPVDFFLHHEVFFSDSDTGRTWMLTDQDKPAQPAPSGFFGHPKSFEILGGVITLKPFSSVVLGDEAILVYYKTPPFVDITDLNVENSIPRLEPFLIRAAIRRVRLQHSDDIQVAQLFQGDVASAAKGYTMDEPKKTDK